LAIHVFGIKFGLCLALFVIDKHIVCLYNLNLKFSSGA